MNFINSQGKSSFLNINFTQLIKKSTDVYIQLKWQKNPYDNKQL